MSFSNGLKLNIDKMYSERFSLALNLAENCNSVGIGTLRERSQHRILKYFLESDSNFHEVPVRSYIADICREHQIFEIQTSSFENLVPKLEAFLTDFKVTLVYPASIIQTVVWTDPITGESIPGRKVKREYYKYKLLPELFYIYDYVGHKNFEILVIKTEVNDIRLLDGRGSDKKIKATKVDKVPLAIHSVENIKSVEDVKKFANIDDNVLYTKNDFQRKFQLKGRNLSYAVKTLLNLGIIKEHSREKRKIYYTSCICEDL